jgi:hypothetical protein
MYNNQLIIVICGISGIATMKYIGMRNDNLLLEDLKKRNVLSDYLHGMHQSMAFNLD